ncbi:MAG: beta-galactosidase trimerization domain-containing protein [Cyclobacteriaceae bacterium]|nr:beta-galactosidase trimerization domain-containing protein [Cyclobacteriaceae bacterium]
MKRRDFIQTSIMGGAYAVIGSHPSLNIKKTDHAINTWFDRPMRWAQLVLVENDPGNFDPDFWLSYFKKVHADASCLSAGGIVAYYPTKIPFHHRSDWLGDSDPFGYLVRGCRDMNMRVIARTDPHAAWENVVLEHPDWIQVNANGEKRKHWSNPDLWITCALGPYNFEFMDDVHREIMEFYEIDGIFSNRWAGHGICYCEHCRKNFKDFSGLELPETDQRLDPVYQKWSEWKIVRLKELWLLWDATIRKEKATSRFIPNGFPDNIVTGSQSDIFFTDHQARSGMIPPWSNGKRAKELRATMGMKPLGGIFSVGIEEAYRWKDSVQHEAEIRVWVAEGTANNMRPWFVKFSGVIYDKRWLDIVERIYHWHYQNEKYLRNTGSLARTAMVYSEQTERNYGGKEWQNNLSWHELGVYHALIESRIPFDMVNDRLLDAANLEEYKLLVLPNVAALSDRQCKQLQKFVDTGGSIVATFETSLYDETGVQRKNFGLADLFGVNYDGSVDGPMKNSYLKFNTGPGTDQYHPVLKGLEDASRMINGVWRLNVTPRVNFPSPVTLIPSYPDLPMEHVYPRDTETDIRELYLRETGNGRVVYIPWDADRTFWNILNVDHGIFLRNIFTWALNEPSPVTVEGIGILDITAWKQQDSMTVHLVNFTNPMMMKGPFRELLPVGEQNISIKVPSGSRVRGVKLLVGKVNPRYELADGFLKLRIDSILDHEVIAIDLG